MTRKGTKLRGFYHICMAYKDGSAIWQIIFSLVFTGIYLKINANILQWISLAFENPQTMQYANLVIAGCVINTVLDVVMTHLSGIPIHKAYTTMNNTIANKVAKADYSLFTKTSCSEVISTAESMWKAVSLMVSIKQVIVYLIELTINIIMVGIIRVELVVPVTIVTPLTGIGGYYLFRWWGKLDSEMDKIKRLRNKELDEVVNGFAEVRGFGTDDSHIESIHSRNNSIFGLIYKRNLVNCGVNLLSESTSGLLTIIALLYGITKLLNGELDSSTGVILVMYIWRMQDPILRLVNCFDTISDSAACLPKLAELLDYENEINDGPIELESIDSSIEFDNVSFSYDKSSTVLSNISFKVKKGQKIGICGPSGGGKSTLLKLIPRYYEVCAGAIKIDGLDIKDMNLKSLRRHIEIVHQDPYIFEDTIYNNIIYGNWECTENDVIEACKRVSIYDFIQSLPDRFNTDVGPKGLKLSGGQKQRIALARIFLANPDIILLDEATSALDNETESIIQQSLDMFKDKTMIVVAHRLTTIKDSDKIVVIDSHRIAEEGTHDELMAKDGLYTKMYK